MSNYEKALFLLKSGIARKHWTFNKSGYISINLCGAYVGHISPFDKHVEVSNDGIHFGYADIDLEKMMVFDTANRRHFNRPIKKWSDTEVQK